MAKIKPLHFRLLRQKLNVRELSFKNTNEIKILAEFIGQKRALEALEFGIGVKSNGYNLYAMGPEGIGKRSLINAILNAKASKSPTPPDWCYVYNFDAPEKPIALSLPAGHGHALQHDMKIFIHELGTNILAIFEGDEYRA